MKTLFSRALWAAVLLALGTGNAVAQGRGFGQGFGGFMQRRGDEALQLLNRPEVQADLKLTEDQKRQLADIAQKSRADLQAVLQQARSGGAVDREKLGQAVRAAQEESRKKVDAVLNADQKKRIKQIALQQEGILAVTRPEVAAELKLTADQKREAGTIVQQQQAAMHNLFQSTDPAAAREKIRTLRKETEDRLQALLTDEQKNRWKEMLGTPLKLSNPPGGFRRPGRPGAPPPG